jgi:hypothetical protein
MNVTTDFPSKVRWGVRQKCINAGEDAKRRRGKPKKSGIRYLEEFLYYLESA